MTDARALRALLVANDGFSAGHVTRTIAIARALERRSRARGLTMRLLLATTSEADTLLAGEPIALVRLPAPLAARRAGFTDIERRRLVRGTLQGACEAFRPDLLVVDTFPAGPHGELAGVRAGAAKRALVRRAVPSARLEEDALSSGLVDHDLAIVADDPVRLDTALPIPVVHVPPITLDEPEAGLARSAARAALGLPLEGPAILVAAGGGGDAEAVAQANGLTETIARLRPDVSVLRAVGPLEPEPPLSGRHVRVAPLQPLLAAFDGAFAPAGYNTAHELAKAGVRAALFARARPFDDQAGRRSRFAEHGLAFALEQFGDAAVAAALAWIFASTGGARTIVPGGGADRAADALLDLATRSP